MSHENAQAFVCLLFVCLLKKDLTRARTRRPNKSLVIPQQFRILKNYFTVLDTAARVKNVRVEM